MKPYKITLLLLMGLLLTVPFYSCNFSKTSQDEEEQRVVRLNYTDWTESVAIAMLVSTVLEEKMGYQVELKLTDIESVYDELAAGEADFFSDAWLPRTHHQYFNKHETAIDTIGTVFRNAKTGLVVPRYSHLHSIPDLEENHIPILGIDEGAGIMNSTKEAIAHYQLENELLILSDDQMTFQMVDSIKRRREVVVTGWEPHWIFSRHKVRFLEDPDNIFPINEHIYSVGNKKSMEEHPNATEFFRRVQLTDDQFNSLIDQVKMATDPVNGVHQWMDKHQYIVNKWIKDLQPERLKVM